MTAQRRITRNLALFALALLPGACDGIGPLATDAQYGVAEGQAARLQQPQWVPFHGSTTGMLVGFMPAPPGRCPMERPILLLYRGRGTATHLGRITVEGSECASPFDPTDPATLLTLSTGDGQFTFTAANGDQLHVGYHATTLGFEPPPSPWLLWTAPIHARGGTGRFAQAELMEVTWSGGANLLTFETYSNLDGGIRYAASDRSGR